MGQRGGGTLYFKIEASILGANQIGLLQKRKKTWEAPHPVNRPISTRVFQLGKNWVTRFIVDTLSNIKAHQIHATFVWSLLMER